jgi:2,3,4,5-tetrahydropyridine-2-carboxylate N-succinyltransferase
VLGAGVILTGTVPVIDAQTGAEVGRGNVPAHSVAITATREKRFGSHSYGLPCVLIIKHLAEGERHDKGKLNDILRDHGATI